MFVKFKTEFKKIFEKCQIFWDQQPLINVFRAWALAILALWAIQTCIILSRTHLWKVKKLLSLQVLYEFAFSALLAISIVSLIGIFWVLGNRFQALKFKAKTILVCGLALFDAYYLKADLENFALRMSDHIIEDSTILLNIILYLLILLITSMLAVIYGLISILLIQARTWSNVKQILAKIVVICLIIGILLINEAILVNDYFRIHFHLNLLGLIGLYAYFEAKIAHNQSDLNQSDLNQSDRFKSPSLYLYALYILIPLVLIQKPSHLVLANFSKFESHYGMRILSHFGYGKAKGVGKLPEIYEQYVNPTKIKEIQESLNQIQETQIPQIQNSNPSPIPKKPPIVILLTIDSLKADLFEGRLLGELKSFENLKKQSLFFSRLYTSSTATRFSLGSMFFGKYPSHLIWKRDSATHPSLEREKGISLAESLKNNQIKSIAITTAKDLMRDQHGIGRGFGQNHLLPPSKKQRVALSHQVIDQMVNVLKKHPKTEPLFIYSHIMDAHHPFDAGLTIGTPYQRYLSELKLVGQQIDQLLAFIKTQTDQDRYYLMITADHGQGFGRHRVKYHNGPPYEHQIKVPFWFYHPLENTQNQPTLNQPALDYSKTPLSLIDLYPTILSIFGITPSTSQQQGFNLWPYLHAIQQKQSSAHQMKAILQKRMLLSVNWHTRALIIPNENLKVIEDTQLGQVMMFDLKKDPNEQVNLCEIEQGKNENLSNTNLSKCDQMANLLRLMIEFQGQQPSEF